ncbi:MAG TPA: hypothetical protein VGC14_02675 [Rhizobium sp.]
MERLELSPEKSKRGRPAIGKGDQINTMVRPEISEAIDKASADQDDTPTRVEMVRRILRDWLIVHGYLKP